jgi:hypothetical protein
MPCSVGDEKSDAKRTSDANATVLAWVLMAVPVPLQAATLPEESFRM